MPDPVLVARGRDLRWLGCSAFILGGLSWVLAGATAALSSWGYLPLFPRSAIDRHPVLALAVFVGATFVLVHAIVTHVMRRTGVVEFHADRLVFRKPGLVFFLPVRVAPPTDMLLELPWSEVAGFRDGSADFIEIVRNTRGINRIDLAVPTPTEEGRVAVLDFLTRRGVQRLDG